MAEFANVRILLVEDQLFIRSMTARMLNGIGFKEILQARDGQDALELLAKSGDPVDVILCDLKMPNMDGFAFVTALRDSALSTAEIPVVVLTASSDAEDVHRLRALGIAGYIVKPASIEMIVKRVRAALRATRKDARA
jgi:CheY-like chemotaxis protein